jgi:hypothetical protein
METSDNAGHRRLRTSVTNPDADLGIVPVISSARRRGAVSRLLSLATGEVNYATACLRVLVGRRQDAINQPPC